MSQNALNILIVDDEKKIRLTLSYCLEGDGHRVTAVEDAKGALDAVRQGAWDLVFLDLRLGQSSGIDLIPELLAQSPWLKIVVITAYASIESAVEAVKAGAADYLPKPFSPEQIRLVARKATEMRRLETHIESLKETLQQTAPDDADIEAQSPKMRQAIELARQVASSEATILLTGESGTGKGVLARAIHRWSLRADRPFSVVHCPSLSDDLLESELFGHARGAFTGAVTTNPGRIARCEGGTLFLDEIAELPIGLQPKLLRFVQDREYERVGDPTTRNADVRFVAATNRDLAAAVREGRFREDLFYRLNVVEISVPPLRLCREDILPLAQRFLAFFNARYNRRAMDMTPEAAEALQNHDWPGNVRELQNAMERAVILCKTEQINPHNLPFQNSGRVNVPNADGLKTLAEVEEAHIRRVLEASNSLEDAADILGMDASTLWRRRKKYGI